MRFDKRPVTLVPHNVLVMWLYYHGVPHPKGTSKQDVINKVLLALSMFKSLDYERLDIDEAINRRSYISWELIEVESDINWITDQKEIVQYLRSDNFPTITDEYITSIF